MYFHEDLAMTIIMQSRLSDSKTIKFRADLRFNQINMILKKEQSVVIPLLTAFCAEEIKLQHIALKNERVRTDMYFSKHKFAVEIHEKGHTDRNQSEENERQTNIEKYSDCKFFHRINPDAEGFNIFLQISKIQVYIDQSNKEKENEKDAKTKELEPKIKEQENNIKEQEDKIKSKRASLQKHYWVTCLAFLFH